MYHHYPSCAIHIQRLKPSCKGQHDRLSPDLRFKHGKNSTKHNETHVSFLRSEFNEKLLNNHGIWVVGSEFNFWNLLYFEEPHWDNATATKWMVASL